MKEEEQNHYPLLFAVREEKDGFKLSFVCGDEESGFIFFFFWYGRGGKKLLLAFVYLKEKMIFFSCGRRDFFVCFVICFS